MANIRDIYEVASKADLGGLKKATGAVKEHGKAIADVAKKAAGMPFKAISKGFAGVKKAAEVGAKGLALFGLATQGLQMARDMLGGLFEAMREKSPEFAKAMDRLSAGFNKAKDTILGAVAKALIPIFEKLADVLEDPRFQAFIETLANFLAGAITKVADFIINQAIPALINFWNSIQPVIETLLGMLIPALESVYQSLARFWNEIQPQLQAAWEAVSNFIETTVGAIVSFIQGHWDQISQIINGAMTYIQGIIEVAWSVIRGIFKVALAIISGDWSAAWDAVKEVASGVWEGIKKIISGAIDIVGGYIGIFGDILRKPWEGLTDFIGGIWEAIKSVISSGINEVIGFINGLIKGYNKTLGRIPGAPHLSEFEPVSLARGGIVSSPLAAIVGDNPRSPEVVSPLSDLVPMLQRALGGAGLGQINLNVTVAPGGFATPEEAGRRAGDAFIDTARARGLRI